MRRRKKLTFRQRTIAIIYDFDGTLSPLPMQEYTVFPRIGITGRKFWAQVEQENRRIKGEMMITYLMKMVECAREKRIRITKADLRRTAERIRYFAGVERYFGRVNRYVAQNSGHRIPLRHYIISAGLREILENISIRKHFHRIYASEYQYDEYGAPLFPKLVVTDTVKTQFLFRINKGREDLLESVNEHMPEHLRPIPFNNMLYIGDGLSDVPSMTVVTKNGGYAIAVYDGNKGRSVCKRLWKAERVHFIARADYTQGSDLDRAIKIVLKKIIRDIEFSVASFQQYRKLLRG